MTAFFIAQIVLHSFSGGGLSSSKNIFSPSTCHSHAVSVLRKNPFHFRKNVSLSLFSRFGEGLSPSL